MTIPATLSDAEALAILTKTVTRRTVVSPPWKYDAAGRRELITKIALAPGDRDTARMRAAGIEPPGPMLVRAMIDTGFNSTLIVAEYVLRELGAAPTGGRAKVHSTFTEQCAYYELDVVIPFTSGGGGGMHSKNTPVITLNFSFDSEERPYDVVIGMAVIANCFLAIDGTTGEFRLEQGQRR